MLVAQFNSNKDGSFRVGLPSGRYTIEASERQGLGVLSPLPVVVRDSRFTYVKLFYDTSGGVR
jgi:hypothetical protein